MLVMRIPMTWKAQLCEIVIKWTIWEQPMQDNIFTPFFKQRLKEEKEAKRARLDGRHDYLFAIVASCLDLNKLEVEDALLEGNQVSLKILYMCIMCFDKVHPIPSL